MDIETSSSQCFDFKTLLKNLPSDKLNFICPYIRKLSIIQLLEKCDFLHKSIRLAFNFFLFVFLWKTSLEGKLPIHSPTLITLWFSQFIWNHWMSRITEYWPFSFIQTIELNFISILIFFNSPKNIIKKTAHGKGWKFHEDIRLDWIDFQTKNYFIFSKNECSMWNMDTA